MLKKLPGFLRLLNSLGGKMLEKKKDIKVFKKKTFIQFFFRLSGCGLKKGFGLLQTASVSFFFKTF